MGLSARAALAAAPLLWTALGGEALAAQAADQAGPSITHTRAALRLDGAPDEPAWLTADSITAFTQSEPDEGRPATERTVVRLLAAPDGLWIGVWAYDSMPARIRHTILQRDTDFDPDDYVTVMLDPLRDHRSGYVFSVNPNGTLWDAEITTYQDLNTDWNGVWDARARITPTGWTAEMVIPWQTLRYRPGAPTWGVNFLRQIRHHNEKVLWRAWRRTEGLLFLTGEGTIGGFERLPRRAVAELRPYGAATESARELQYPPDGPDSVVRLAAAGAKAGLDVKLAPAPTLTLDLTVNTDFAQAEADNQVINLTRFPLFFPEKRSFFLESSGVFDFGELDRATPFYSRRIGLDALGQPVPLDAGARLTGRIGPDRIGLLAVRTGGAEDAFDLVARVKHDVLARGYVGGIVASQSTPDSGGSRLAEGVDFDVPLYVRGQNLVLHGWAFGAKPGPGLATATAWQVWADYPNDLVDAFGVLMRVGPGFDPALGFVRETDILLTRGHLDLLPRPHALGIRRLEIEPLTWEYARHSDGTLSHATYTVTPIGALFQSGDEAFLSWQRFEDVPTAPFTVFRGDTIAPGDYRYDRAQVVFTSSPGRPVSAAVVASAGDYYTGTATEVDATLTVRIAPHVIATGEYDHVDARLATSRFAARTGRLRLDVAATPRLATTAFVQWDDESDRLTVNARLHWIVNPGSDAYLVWNSAWPTGLAGGLPWGRPARGGLVGKLVYYFRL